MTDVNKNHSKPKRKWAHQIACEVVRGKWGDGEERNNRLEEAGYNHRVIQDIVNRIIRMGRG